MRRLTGLARLGLRWAPGAPAWTASLPAGYEAMTILADDRVLLTPEFPRAGL